jgi:hypothetical protein
VERLRSPGVLRVGFLALQTVVFGIAGLIALPSAIYSVASQLFNGSYSGGAGETVATALVITPLWAVCLYLLIRHTRAAPSPQTGVPPA